MSLRYDPDKHHRQSNRLASWDYSTPGAYFITIYTHQRKNSFEDCQLRKLADAWNSGVG